MDGNRRRWTTSDIPPQTGRCALVTGANSVIGFHTALEEKYMSDSLTCPGIKTEPKRVPGNRRPPNVGSTPERMMLMTNGSGIDEYFAYISELRIPQDLDRLAEIISYYGYHYLPPAESAADK